MKLDKMPWNVEKIARKGSKHGSWILVGFLTGLTFVGYFTPIRELVVDLFTFNAAPAAVFWVMFFLIATYANAGFLREQVCKYMCPYARFQSVMYDAHTLVVTYNEKRGEKRGPRKPKVDYREQGLGDCIDCTWCVQVCPVDIDIRDGLQYECINCGLCVDACDSIMDKMGYDRGLISFTTENNIAGGKTKLVRPRLLGYVFFIVLMAGALIATLVQRVPMEADIERDRNVMHRINNDGFIENPYRVKIVNMLGDTHRYELRIIDNERFVLSGDTSIEVEGGDVKEGIILITVDPADIDRFRYDIEVEVKAIDDPDLVKTIETRFMAPQVR